MLHSKDQESSVLSVIFGPRSEMQGEVASFLGMQMQESAFPELNYFSKQSEFRRRWSPDVIAEMEAAVQRMVGAAIQQTSDQREMRWLSTHRRQYGGRWVALKGDQLLAEGNTARDVFAVVRNRRDKPLVVRVDLEDEPPFSGW